MLFRKKSLSDQTTYGIVGLGRFGYALAMELASTGADLIVLDKDEEKIRELREVTENAYVMRSLDKSPCRRRASRTATSRWCASASRWIPRS